MKALILQHEESTPPGSTLDWLKARHISYEIAWPSEMSEMPSTANFDFLFICGGSMNVDQEDKFPWLRMEKDFIRKSIQENKKLVGLCLGGQLIAEVMGGTVKKHPQYEVGWQTVELKNGESLKVFEWHGYSFSLPPGAQLEATNSNCINQAFSFGTRVLAFQFHPETTREWAIACAANPKLPTEGFVQTSEEILKDLKYQPQLQSWYFSRLDSITDY